MSTEQHIPKRKWLRWTFFALTTGLLLFLSVSWVFAHRLTRPRPRVIGPVPADFPYSTENITLTTADQKTISGWFVPAENAKGAIVLLHGYTGNRLQMLSRARFFRKLGYAVFLYDARACGESTGEFITFGYRERDDLVAAVQFLKDRGLTSIACLGVSQGGATILFAADQLGDVKCLICESVYDEMTHAVDRRMRKFTGLPGWLGASAMVPIAEHRLGLSIDEVKPAEYISALKCPVFIMSGDKDDRTWPEDTIRLFEAAHEPKELWMVPDAVHEDLFHYPGYQEKVASFLQRHLP
jgi:uncharacterized protein